MDALRLDQVAEMAGGRVAGSPEALCLRVCKDSRSIRKGDLYVAIEGDRFDGHDFVRDAFAGGAVAALVADHSASRWPGANLVIVRDRPLDGLQRLAAAWRRSLPLQVVGVTGSNGKTSVKDMCSSVLSVRYPVLATAGNYNNAIGVPLTLLEAGSAHRFAVVEMGMNHAGEIAPLAAMAAPDIGVVTNVGCAHIEFLGSREAIAVEKGALVRALTADAIAILPAGDDYLDTLRHDVRARIVLAGVGQGDVAACDPRPDGDGMVFSVKARGRSLACRVARPGVHMVHNAALAVAVGLEAGLSLEECRDGLAHTRFTEARLEFKNVAGVRFLDDSYNANPDSMQAALAVLAAETTGRRWAVLGAMGELGRHAQEGHSKVGEACAAAGIDGLITLGPDASGIAMSARRGGCTLVIEADDHEEAARMLIRHISPGDTVLLKGSRSARTELVLQYYSSLASGPDGHQKP